ncbi:MAG: DoxX family protein [Candidatus Pacebacteria bacterium]|nr:DoxX family protein [Candidatus Paceibacterota bacterium]
MLQRISLFLLRISLGWLFFYAGITKVLNASWTSSGYLAGAKTFPELFQFFAQPNVLPFVDFLNEWGLTLIGLSLIIGVFTRLSSVLGIILMALYYLPILQFPYPNEHAYIVDEHVVYAIGLLVIYAFDAGRVWGLGRFLARG